MTTCPDCRYHNRAGVLLCEQCHADLYDALMEQVSTRQLAQVRPLSSSPADHAPSLNPIVVYISSDYLPFAIERRAGIVLGCDASGDGVDIDVSVYNGHELGVSRRHARFDAHSDPPTITDLNSTNGTFVNEARIPVHQAVVLRSGDEVRLGRMVLRLYFK